MTTQVWLHCYALDGVTNFMFSPGGLQSLDSENDFEIMEELTYHQSLQSSFVLSIASFARLMGSQKISCTITFPP